MGQYRNDKLTECITNIFGDIVSDVYAIVSDVGDYKYEAYLDKEIRELSYEINSISHGTTDVVIVFKNGKSVLFSASEYGDMGSVLAE